MTDQQDTNLSPALQEGMRRRSARRQLANERRNAQRAAISGMRKAPVPSPATGDVRLMNVRAEIKRAGSQNAFAEALGVSKSQVSRFAGANPEAEIPDDTARDWEIKLGLAPGALDQA